MRGPTSKKMPNKDICTGCDFLIEHVTGGTRLFPKITSHYYCKHPKLPFEGEIAFIKKDKPWTPKWCPEKKQTEG